MDVKVRITAEDDLTLGRSGNSLVLRVTHMADALELEQGDVVHVTLEKA